MYIDSFMLYCAKSSVVFFSRFVMLKFWFFCALGSSSLDLLPGVGVFRARMLSMLKDGLEFDEGGTRGAGGPTDACLAAPREALLLSVEVKSTLLTSRFSRLPGRALVFSSRRCFALLF